MTNTEVHTPHAWLFVNSACKFGFKMVYDQGPSRLFLDGRKGRIELIVLDPEGSVRLTAFRATGAHPIEVGSIEVTNLPVDQFEGLLRGWVQTIDPKPAESLEDRMIRVAARRMSGL